MKNPFDKVPTFIDLCKDFVMPPLSMSIDQIAKLSPMQVKRIYTPALNEHYEHKSPQNRRATQDEIMANLAQNVLS